MGVRFYLSISRHGSRTVTGVVDTRRLIPESQARQVKATQATGTFLHPATLSGTVDDGGMLWVDISNEWYQLE